MTQRLIISAMPMRSTIALLCTLAGVFSAQQVFALEVALIGDRSKREAFQVLVKETGGARSSSAGVIRATSRAKDLVFTVTESSEDPFVIANQLLTADLALLVVDSTQGPLPITREQLIVARQTRVPDLAIYFSRTRTLQVAAPKDAAELLQLEEAEMRALLNSYEMKGEAASVLFDSDVSRISKSKDAKGIPDLRRHLGTVNARRPQLPGLGRVTEFSCYYYLLSSPEANGRSATLSDGDRVDVWLEGRSTSGTVRTKTRHEPGGHGEFVLTLATPLPVQKASRTILARNGSVVGVGMVKNVLH